MIDMKRILTRSPNHWGSVVAYLSMDSTEPFWRPLGYAPFALTPVELREGLRAVIERLRAAYAERPDLAPDIRPVLFDGIDLPIAEAAPLADLGSLMIFDHTDEPQQSAWQIALSDFPRGFESVVAASSELAAVWAEFRRRLQVPVIARPTRLSAWDARMCARHRWNPHDPASFPPFDSLSIAMRIGISQAAILWLRERIDGRVLRRLRDDAQLVIDEIGIWMPSELKLPASE